MLKLFAGRLPVSGRGWSRLPSSRKSSAKLFGTSHSPSGRELPNEWAGDPLARLSRLMLVEAYNPGYYQFVSEDHKLSGPRKKQVANKSKYPRVLQPTNLWEHVQLQALWGDLRDDLSSGARLARLLVHPCQQGFSSRQTKPEGASTTW